MNKTELRRRYWRKSDSLPKGDLHHREGCEFFNYHICTCGLLLDLSGLRSDPKKALIRYPAMKECQDQALSRAQRYFGSEPLPRWMTSPHGVICCVCCDGSRPRCKGSDCCVKRAMKTAEAVCRGELNQETLEKEKP